MLAAPEAVDEALRSQTDTEATLRLAQNVVIAHVAEREFVNGIGAKGFCVP